MTQNKRELALLAARELKRRQAFKIPISDKTFPEQDNFVQDESQFIAALCTRRAGKSTGLGIKLLNKAKKYPGSLIPYVGLTRESCENIMWPVFTELNEKHKIRANMTVSDLEITLPNRAKIKLFGADQKGFIEKLRGPKYPIAAIDEAQAFKSHIATLVDDVFTPATGDFLDGQIVLTGTPGPVPKGFFYDASIGKMGFTPHAWTVYQNPYFPRPKEFVEKLFKTKGWTVDNPTYRREWLGEWVSDLEALVYRFRKDRNLTPELPQEKEFYYVIGVDLGYFPDPSAFVVGAYHKYANTLYLIETFQKDRMTVSDVAEMIKGLLKRYRDARVVMDLGAQGKMIGEEIMSRYQIPLIAAEKHGKAGFIEIFNSELAIGNIKLIEGKCDELIDEWSNLIWDSEKSARVEDDRLPNHLSDAALYLHRYCFNYAFEQRPERIERGSEREIELYWENEAKKLEAQRRAVNDDDLF